MVMDPHICRRTSCRYNNYESGNEYKGSCNYCWITGHTRTAQLTKEELQPKNCPLYDKGEKLIKERERIPNEKTVRLKMEAKEKRVKVDPELARGMYDAGLYDGDIARKLGCTHSAIAMWRQRNHLPPNGPGGRMRQEENARRTALYQAGKTDREIAEEIGCSRNSIQKWRDRNELPVNPERRK